MAKDSSLFNTLTSLVYVHLSTCTFSYMRWCHSRFAEMIRSYCQEKPWREQCAQLWSFHYKCGRGGISRNSPQVVINRKDNEWLITVVPSGPIWAEVIEETSLYQCQIDTPTETALSARYVRHQGRHHLVFCLSWTHEGKSLFCDFWGWTDFAEFHNKTLICVWWHDVIGPIISCLKPFRELINLNAFPRDCWYFMHLTDAFIQSNFVFNVSVYALHWESNPWPCYC